jgi:hypothetical protein
VCGNDALADASIDTPSGSCLVPVADDGDVITNANCSIVSAGEGGQAALGCLYVWSESGSCNDSDDNADTAAAITDPNCSKVGVDGACSEVDCDSSDWGCGIDIGIYTDSYNCLDDGDTVVGGDLLPDSATEGNGTITTMSGDWTWNEGACTSPICDGGAGSTNWTDPGGCGSIDPVSCDYQHGGGTLPSPANDCIENITASRGSGSDASQMTSQASGAAPVIVEVFPFMLNGDTTAAKRMWSNAHPGDPGRVPAQGISILLSGAAPTTTTVACTPGVGPVVNFSCDNGFPVDNCDPTSNFQEQVQYSCDVFVQNGAGTDSSNGNILITGTADAPDLPVAGGMGGGYVGGNHATWPGGPGTGVVDAGTVCVRLIDFETLQGLPAGAYLQAIIGTTMFEFYIASGGQCYGGAPSAVIDEMTFGYKCGATECAHTAAASYNNYMFTTMHDVDANDLVVRMELTSYAYGFENDKNPARKGRNRATITGTISEASLQAYVDDRPNTVRLRTMFAVPTHLRAGFALMSLRSVYSLSLDLLLASGDEENSVALCLFTEGTGAAVPAAAPLPPNIVIPELLRTQWWDACANWATNSGDYDYEVWHWVANDPRPLEFIGVWANATSFSPTTLAGGLDIFVFPLYVCALGTVLLTTGDLETIGDDLMALGDTPLEFDLREDWVNNTETGGVSGYDPDGPGIEKNFGLHSGPTLPIDPARLNATLDGPGQGDYAGWSGASSGITNPNRTDSKLHLWGDTSNWDARFYRKGIIHLSGAFAGYQSGMVVFGLQINQKVDDNQFTLYQVGFLRSTGVLISYENQNPWNPAANSNLVSREMTAINSQTTDGDGAFNFTPIQRSGPAYYAAISLVMRGSWNENKDAIPGSPHYLGGQDLTHDTETSSISNPGQVIAVRGVGPVDSSTYFEGDGNRNIFITDFMNMPTLTAPGADEYIYPAPQWSSTIGNVTPRGATMPVNRNAEIARVLTPTVSIQTDAGDFQTRRYFEFTVPTMMRNTAKRPDQWYLSVDADAEFGMKSAKSMPHDTDGACGGTGATTRFYDDDAVWLSQGITAGDPIRLNKGGDNHNTTVASVDSDTALTLTTAAPEGTWADRRYVEYWIIRQGTPDGECLFDEWFGASGLIGGGGCRQVSIWTFTGPVPDGAGSIRVHIPAVSPGARTLGGVGGVVPDPYEGNSVDMQGEIMEWTASMIAFGTQEVWKGGMGTAGFDWNNQNFWKSEFAISDNSQDAAKFLWQ